MKKLKIFILILFSGAICAAKNPHYFSMEGYGNEPMKGKVKSIRIITFGIAEGPEPFVRESEEVLFFNSKGMLEKREFTTESEHGSGRHEEFYTHGKDHTTILPGGTVRFTERKKRKTTMVMVPDEEFMEEYRFLCHHRRDGRKDSVIADYGSGDLLRVSVFFRYGEDGLTESRCIRTLDEENTEFYRYRTFDPAGNWTHRFTLDENNVVLKSTTRLFEYYY